MIFLQAVDIAPTEVRSHESTFEQAKLLLEKLGTRDEINYQVLAVFKTHCNIMKSELAGINEVAEEIL